MGRRDARHTAYRIGEDWEISSAIARTQNQQNADDCDDLGETDFGQLALRLLLNLNASYPRPIDISDEKRTAVDRAHIEQFWAYFMRQGIVGGSIAKGKLTSSGREALNAAFREEEETGTHPRDMVKLPGGTPASVLLLGVLRRHFAAQVNPL